MNFSHWGKIFFWGVQLALNSSSCMYGMSQSSTGEQEVSFRVQYTKQTWTSSNINQGFFSISNIHHISSNCSCNTKLLIVVLWFPTIFLQSSQIQQGLIVLNTKFRSFWTINNRITNKVDHHQDIFLDCCHKNIRDWYWCIWKSYLQPEKPKEELFEKLFSCFHLYNIRGVSRWLNLAASTFFYVPGNWLCMKWNWNLLLAWKIVVDWVCDWSHV